MPTHCSRSTGYSNSKLFSFLPPSHWRSLRLSSALVALEKLDLLVSRENRWAGNPATRPILKYLRTITIYWFIPSILQCFLRQIILSNDFSGIFVIKSKICVGGNVKRYFYGMFDRWLSIGTISTSKNMILILSPIVSFNQLPFAHWILMIIYIIYWNEFLLVLRILSLNFALYMIMSSLRQYLPLIPQLLCKNVLSFLY
jgi:hypothetical protein